MRLEKDYAVFKQLVLIHSVERPPLSKMILSNIRKLCVCKESFKEIHVIWKFVMEKYFAVYDCFKDEFTEQVVFDCVIRRGDAFTLKECDELQVADVIDV